MAASDDRQGGGTEPLVSVAPVFVERGKKLLASGNYREVVRICRLGLLVAPRQVEGHLLLATALSALGRDEEVVAETGVVIDLDQDNESAFLLRGESLVRLGQGMQARESLERARHLGAPAERIDALMAQLDLIHSGERPRLVDPSATTVAHARPGATAVDGLRDRDPDPRNPVDSLPALEPTICDTVNDPETVQRTALAPTEVQAAKSPEPSRRGVDEQTFRVVGASASSNNFGGAVADTAAGTDPAVEKADVGARRADRSIDRRDEPEVNELTDPACDDREPFMGRGGWEVTSGGQEPGIGESPRRLRRTPTSVPSETRGMSLSGTSPSGVVELNTDELALLTSRASIGRSSDADAPELSRIATPPLAEDLPAEAIELLPDDMPPIPPSSAENVMVPLGEASLSAVRSIPAEPTGRPPTESLSAPIRRSWSEAERARPPTASLSGPVPRPADRDPLEESAAEPRDAASLGASPLARDPARNASVAYASTRLRVPADPDPIPAPSPAVEESDHQAPLRTAALSESQAVGAPSSALPSRDDSAERPSLRGRFDSSFDSSVSSSYNSSFDSSVASVAADNSASFVESSVQLTPVPRGRAGGAALRGRPFASRQWRAERTSLWTVVFGERGQRRTTVLVIVGVAVVGLALIGGLVVRGQHVRRKIQRHYELAMARLRQGNWSDFTTAGQVVAELAAKRPGDSRVVISAGWIRAATSFEFGTPSNNEPAVPSAKDPLSDSDRAVYEIYHRLVQGKLAEAGKLAFSAIELYPKHARLQYLVGRIEGLRERHDAAAKHFARADELGPGDAMTLAARGSTELARAQLRAALAQFQRALSVNPLHVGSLLGSAACLVEGGQLVEATQLVQPLINGQQRSLASPAQRGRGLLLLARIQLANGDVGAADALLRESEQAGAWRDPAFVDDLLALLMSLSRLGDAERVAVRAEASLPGRAGPLLRLARVYLREGRVAQALQAAERVGDSPAASLLRAEVQLRLNQPAAARQTLKRVPQSTERRLLQGRLLLAEGRMADAEELARELAARQPGRADAQVLLGDILLRGSRADEAERAYQRATEIDPNDIAPRLRLITAKQMQGRWKPAQRDLIALTRRYPWSVEAVKQMAAGDIGSYHLADARAALERLLRKNPRDQEARLLLVRALAMAFEIEAAERSLAKVQGVAPGERELAEGRLALAAGDGERAVRALRTAVTKLGADPLPRALLARAYLLRNQIGRAQAVLGELYRRFPQSLETLEVTGRIELAGANPSGAVVALQRAVRSVGESMRPPAERAATRTLLGVAYQEDGQLKVATKEYRQASKLCALCPEPIFRLGLARDEAGDTREAITSLRRAAELSPRMPVVSYELGKIYQGLGDRKQAIRMYERYLSLAPPEDFARQVRKTLADLQR